MLVSLVFLFLASTHGSIIPQDGDVEENSAVRIIGGDDAPDGLAPYQVSLQVNRHFCGGSILDNQWILTAGHCVLKRKTVTVVAGIHKLSEGGDLFAVEKQIRHPKFSMKEGIKNDIALLKLADKMEFTDKIQPIALPTKDTEAGANLMVTGWGLTTWSGHRPDHLQMLNQTALGHEECKKRSAEAGLLVPIIPTHLCAYKDVGHAAYKGDSGGPLVEGNTLVGVQSFGKSWAKGVPDVYSRVFSYLDWIKETMKAN